MASSRFKQSKYDYTLDEFADKVFTKQQRDFYEENGYIIVRNVLPISDINACNKRFDDVVSNPSLRLNESLLMRDISLIKKNKKKSLTTQRTQQFEITKLQDFAYDPVFWKHYFCNDNILKYVQAFTGNDIRSWTQMYINKPADPGTLSSRHALHQDLFYWPITNPNRVCACWIALQTINRMNGGLCVVPRSHRYEPVGKLLAHDYPQWNSPHNAYYYGIPHDIYTKVARYRKHISMNAGDAIFFHPLTVHGSSANLTNKFRRSLCCHFMNSTVCQFKAYDPKIHIGIFKDIQKVLKKEKKALKVYANNSNSNMPVMDLKTSWKLRTRQVMGDCGHWAFDKQEIEKWSKHFYKRELTKKQIAMNTSNQSKL